MVGYYNQGVPTNVELENNSNQNKYTVNRSKSGSLVISKALCSLMAIGALLLAVLVGLVVFFLVPRHCNASLEALTQSKDRQLQAYQAAEIDERLPRSIVPTHYRLKIIPNFVNSTTAGSVAVTLKVLEATDTIIFHVSDILIDEHSVIVESINPNSSLLECSRQEYLEGDKYKIMLKDTLKKDEEYLLNLKFNGILNGHLQGLYLSRYREIDGSERVVASTQFSPTDARRAFPCFDEPSFKAKFEISLGRPSNMNSMSNMPLNRTESMLDQKDWSWDHYTVSPDMPTYLVAFMVHDLQPGPNSTQTIKVWSSRKFSAHTRYAAQLAPKLLEYFETYFKIKFPLPKMDIVAVPEFGFSAMENWGLITFRESSLLYNPQVSTNEDRRTIATVMSHEMAHQWFGNLVTPKWWNDLWLKEGFATYMEYFGVDHAHPKWKFVEEFIISETDRAMAIDALETARPISFEVHNSKQIRQAFDDISYSKGACIIRMMNHFLGEHAFRNGLINYLEKYKDKNADRYDLFESLTEEAHKDGALLANETVTDIMETWTERPGFPVVHVMADYANNKLRIYQRRFFLSGKDENSSWWIPLSMTTQKRENVADTKPKFWLRGEAEAVQTIDLTDNSWYLININATGYFIVNYDERNWKALTENIMSLPPLTRAQLISDSMDLARANLIAYDIPLRMIARMAVLDKDIMIIPTMVAMNKLKFLNDILIETPAYGLFEQFHQTVFGETYSQVTLHDIYEDYITHRIRLKVLEWSCLNSESPCSHESRTMFRRWMTTGISIDPDVRQIVYCTAVRDGGDVEWGFAYKKYLETHSPSEKNMLLDALGCTRLKWVLSRYTDLLTVGNSSIRIQDADRVFESVAKNEAGTAIAFDFLRKNWNSLVERYGDGFNILSRMIKSVGNRMNTEFQLSELQRFRESIKQNISTTSSAFDSAIETAKSNVRWMERNYKQVVDWFTAHKTHFQYL